MKFAHLFQLLLAALVALDAMASEERLGKVEFANSCSENVQPQINRGIALLHDFWYEKAESQFRSIYKQDPQCAIAHWAVAMSLYHQIWSRPDEEAFAKGVSEIQTAKSIGSKDPRELGYISAAALFFTPGKTDYESRVKKYSAAMGDLYKHYSDDPDAASFYALSLLASEEPGGIGLANERRALAILNPLLEKYKDHPGIPHYIIHSCDNPAMAQQGLHAAELYGDVAPSAPHAAHMPSHIFSRLGMWQEDIHANLLSIAAAKQAETDDPGDAAHAVHAYDFLLYAYLQTSQDAKAKDVVIKTTAILNQLEGMSNLGLDRSFVPMHRLEFPIFYSLEHRDWSAAAKLSSDPAALPESQLKVFWARGIAEGHLHHAEGARANLSELTKQEEAIRKGPHAYFLEGSSAEIAQHEIEAWVAFAEGNKDLATDKMRAAAALQDEAGQHEVDIPAREMLADILLECKHPQQALREYETALKKSPNRFNGLYGAGMAAEALGDRAKAIAFYMRLLKQTDRGANSERPELAHAKRVASIKMSSN